MLRSVEIILLAKLQVDVEEDTANRDFVSLSDHLRKWKRNDPVRKEFR